MNRMKVLQIGKYYHPYYGGTENHLLTLVNELKKNAEVEVIVANTRFKTSIEKKDGVNIYRLACLGSIFSLPLVLSLPLWLKKRKADILHFHLPHPLSVLAYFFIRPKGKIVVTYHSDIIRQKFLATFMNPFLFNLLKKAACIIVTSENLLRYSSILKNFKDKCKVIPLGIDVGRFKPDQEVLKDAEEIRHRYGSPLILFVGRLVYYKGLEFLFMALEDIDAKLLVVGTGYLKNKLKKLAKRLGVSHKVIWIEGVEDSRLPSYYYASEIFVLPSSSKAESFGIVQLEAFACGKPVVSTDLPTGVPFVNLNNRTGLIVPSRDPLGLAEAINKLLRSQELRQNYGQNGRERLEREFTKERMAEDVMEVYKKALCQ